jgi:hypothetical protein
MGRTVHHNSKFCLSSLENRGEKEEIKRPQKTTIKINTISSIR